MSRAVRALGTLVLITALGIRSLDTQAASLADWRAQFIFRLATCFPGRARHGIHATQIGQVLGLRSSTISNAINHYEFDLNYEQTEVLAKQCGVSVEYLLAMELLESFSSLEDLGRAVDREGFRRRNLILKAYVLGLEAKRRTAAKSSLPVEFVTRWRAEVRRRLATLIPNTKGTANASRVYVKGLADLLDQEPAAVSLMLNGPQYLTFAAAMTIANAFNVNPEWVLAADLTAEFGSVEAIERGLAAERKPLVAQMIRLHGLNVQANDCTSGLAR